MKMREAASVLKSVSKSYRFLGNIWSASRHIRPEKVAVPLHQMLWQPTPRCGAATSLSICFSSTAGDGIIRPGRVIRPEQMVRPAGIIQPEGAVFSSRLSSATGDGIIRPGEINRPEQIVRPAGIIQPEGPVFSSRRGFSSGASTNIFLDPCEPTFDSYIRLPVLRQISFYEPGDIDMSKWEDPISFLRRTCIARPVLNRLIDRPDLEPLMLTPIGRKLWRSAVRLVSANRRRGYCIGKSLVEENLAVSIPYGTFGLKKAIADDISGQPKSDFIGYKNLGHLFEMLMKKAYGDGILGSLSSDIGNFQATLLGTVADDGPAEYHAAMLAPPGRAWMSIRLASLLRGELRSVLGQSAESAVQLILENIPYLSFSEEYAHMHEFFNVWTDHSENQRRSNTSGQLQQPQVNQSSAGQPQHSAGQPQQQVNQSSAGQPQQPEVLMEPEDQELSVWARKALRVVALNRNGILHPYGKELKELSKVRPGRRYKVEDIVELLHIKMPLYLPLCQKQFLDAGCWDWLEMPDCFPEEIPYF